MTQEDLEARVETKDTFKDNVRIGDIVILYTHDNLRAAGFVHEFGSRNKIWLSTGDPNNLEPGRVLIKKFSLSDFTHYEIIRKGVANHQPQEVPMPQKLEEEPFFEQVKVGDLLLMTRPRDRVCGYVRTFSYFGREYCVV